LKIQRKERGSDLIMALVALVGADAALDAGDVAALNAMRAAWGASVLAHWPVT
jgi:hypothetical protein